MISGPAGPARQAQPAPRARVALLGVGTVGSAVLDRLAVLDRPGGSGWAAETSLVLVGSSRQLLADPEGIEPADAVAKLRTSEVENDLAAVARALGPDDAVRVVVDATASAAVAARHAHWLLRGIHVVTASKIANGGSQASWDAIRTTAQLGGVTYGSSATVGAGLPVIATLERLVAGGDEVLEIAGVLSGSLAWILDAYQRESGSRPFDALVAEAHARGYTEPDPLVDLSGDDVRRKLLVLARTAGARLQPDDVDVQAVDAAAVAAAAEGGSAGEGGRLRHVARWSSDGAARIEVTRLPSTDPLATGNGPDNVVVVRTTRYDAQPLTIIGPGAGAAVTAGAVLDDVAAAVTAGRVGPGARATAGGAGYSEG